MLKAVGICLMFLGCTGAGLAASGALKERVRALEELKHMLKMLDGEIRHTHASLPEAFLRTGKRSKPPFSDFLLRAAVMMEESGGMDLPAIIRAAGEETLRESVLTPEDREILLALGDRLRAQDVESQLGILQLAWDQTQVQTGRAREEYQQKARVVRYLGVLGGLFLAVLFI
ncbi:MAG: stage III sporulation protein AB [Candidatus Limivivens sp.]|nr:stage III sporulation protein AB [Candidatus Limivivens sp.]